MNQSKIEIKEATLTETKTIKKVIINIFQLELHKSCMLNYHLLDENDRLVKADMMRIEGEEYQGWNADDGYIENLVLSKLGYSRATSN